MMEAHQFHDLMPQGKFEFVTDVAATIAIASPWWLPLLKETSEIAGLLLPIFGSVWLIVQIGFKFYAHFKSRSKG